MTSEIKITASVIVPCSRPEAAGPTLEALLKQTVDANQVEIIVVTPAPASGFPDAANFRVVTSGELFAPGKMRNLGAAAARGDVFLFIDDDCIPPANWVESMTGLLREQARWGAVGCTCRSLSRTFMAQCADYCLFGVCRSVKREFRAVGAGAMAVRREAFVEVDGFNPELLASEDWDFCLRLEEKGWVSVFEPSVEVRHNHRRKSVSGILRSAYNSGLASGVTVQQQWYDHMSCPARLSVRMRHPVVYPFLAVPYACAVAAAQCIPNIRVEPAVLLYLPLAVCSRLAYHLGVWNRLRRAG